MELVTNGKASEIPDGSGVTMLLMLARMELTFHGERAINFLCVSVSMSMCPSTEGQKETLDAVF